MFINNVSNEHDVIHIDKNNNYMMVNIFEKKGIINRRTSIIKRKKECGELGIPLMSSFFKAIQ